jgi:DNA repair protein RadC
MEKEMEYLKIGEALIGEEQVIEMAKYINHLEQENAKLLGELQQTKSYLSATLQQRNSAENKLRTLVLQKQNTIDIKPIVTNIATNVNLINPEQWAVPAGRVITTPKSNKI